MTDSEKYQILDVDRESSPEVYQDYYPRQIIAHSGKVEPLVDGVNYFNDLYQTMESLTGVVASKGIYLINWAFSNTFEIQPGIKLTDYLKTKAASGVDVRVLIWVNEFMIASPPNWNIPDFENWIPYFDIPISYLEILEEGRDYALKGKEYWIEYMIANLDTLEELRSEPALAQNAQANTLDYPVGSSHAKFALIFDQYKAIGYTGGMDFEGDRISDSVHFNDPNPWYAGYNAWHDIQAKVYGDISQELFDYFRELWNELVYLKDNAASLGYKVPTFLSPGRMVVGTTPNATSIPVKSWPPSTGSNQHFVQSLRTLPHKSHSFSYLTPPDKFDFTFAPNGAYEIQLAVKKAIGNAETYVYIEDQAMYSREILGYLKNAIINKPALVVILMTGPLDPDVPQDQRNYAIPHYLIDQLPQQSQKNRVGVYIHNSAYLHSKLFLIDDKFAVIGSAGLYNRAMFVEMEHAISFVDQNPASGSIKQLRQNLWAEHFKLLAAEKPQIEEIHDALAIWQPAWGGGFPTYQLPIWAQSSFDFPTDVRILDGIEIPTCLVPYSIFKIDANGDGLPGSSTAFDGREYQSEPALFYNGGADFIIDLGLPNSLNINLTGKWIKVIEGPNAGSLLRVVNHAGYSIFLQAPGLVYDSTTKYRVFRPYIDKVEMHIGLPEPAQFESFIDCGELPE